MDLTELPTPAPHYVTPAMASNSLKVKGIAWPISGDLTARASPGRERDLLAYIHLARQRST